MRSLKRIVTLMLAIVMAVSCVGITALAASFSDITDQRVSEAVDKLVGFNIITGYEDGTFKPDNQITRAEFAAIVTRYKGIADNLAADAVTGFSDLDNDSSRAWARPYVKAAVDAKIINGFDDGTFRAGEPVTYEQAVKMLVCAAGYEIVAQSEYNKAIATNPNATWSAGYIAAANKHGITKGVITAKITEPAVRGVVAVLTSNTLDVPELKENEDGTVEKVDPDEQTNQNVEEITGIVSATYYTAIDAASADISQKEIEIRANGEDTVYDLSDTALNSVDMEKLVGKRVKLYYDKLERKIDKEIKVISQPDIVIDEADVISASADSVRYYNENGNPETASLSGYTIIYNGKYGEANKLATDFTNGTIEIVEAQKMAYVTSYRVGVVSGYTKESNNANGKITFKYVTGADATYDVPASTSSKPTVYVNGTKTEFSSLSLSPYDVINLLESSDKKINKMYVTKGAKTGKITAGLGEERVVELNNTELTLTQQYVDYTPTGSEEKAPFELGETYTYYLDYTGQIAAVKYDSNTQGTYKYGYLTAAGENRKDNNYVVKIASVESGSVTEYALNSNVKVDGVSVKDSEVLAKLEAAALAISNPYRSQTIAQPVRYETSGTTIVKTIDTLTSDAGGASDNFTRNTEGGTNSTVTTGSITQGGVSLSVTSSKTKILYVPNDVSEDTSFAKLSTDAFKRTVTRVEAFNVGSDKIAPFVIVYGANNPTHVFTATSPYMIVTGTSHSGDDMTIKGYQNGGTNPDASITVNSEYYRSSITGAMANYSDIKKGDLIRYILNGSKVIAIERWYDADNPSQAADYQSDSNPKRKENKREDGDSTSRYYLYGMIFAASATDDVDKNVALSKYIPTDSVDADTKAVATNATYFNCKSSKFYELDSSGNVILHESFPTLNGYNKETNTADIAIMVTPNDDPDSKPAIVYIINN